MRAENDRPTDIEAYDFDLPPHLIAARPIVPRDAARLLHVGTELTDKHVRDLPKLLAPGDILVVNDTRVIPVRLRGRRGTAKVEVTLHKEAAPDRWCAFARPARKLRPGDRLSFAADFEAEVVAKREGGEIELRFDLAGPDLVAALGRFGAAPLPPYIRREHGPDDRDREDYQTIFAVRDGAVAAPTAGLHFTDGLLAALAERDIDCVAVTLHVGAGTFLPVKVSDLRQHRMHAESGLIEADSAAAINRARAAGGRVVAVGSTSLRLLESAVRADGTVQPYTGETSLFITPGYRFKVADILLTNFHLPRSTLFFLVAAFAGLARMHAAYEHAKSAGYRFYSYGDCCLLERLAER